MSTFRSSRLRVEVLEGRAVPAVITGTDPNVTDTSVPAQTGTTQPGTDPTANPVVVINTGATNPGTTSTTAGSGTPQVPAVDLAVTTTVDAAKPSLGDTITVKVSVTNSGPVQSTGANVAVTLPAGLSFVSSDAGTAFDPTSGTWKPGTIAANGSAVLTIKAKVTDPATQPVTAAVTQADQPDGNAQNNSANLTVSPVLAKLNLKSSMSAATAGTGSIVVMTVAVSNTGPGKARDVSVATTLGSGLTLITILGGSQGSYSPATGTWNAGVVNPGTTVVLRLLVRVTQTGPIQSAAVLTATGYDATTSNLNASTTITGVKPAGMPTWAYFGPKFSNPIVVPVSARGTLAGGGTTLTSQILRSLGFPAVLR